MATERDVQDAEQAKLAAVVAELGTEAERDELEFVSALAGLGVPVWEGGVKVASGESLRRLLARLVRRAERRARLGLPLVSCAGDPPTEGCACLERALDESDGGKRAVVRLAGRLHWSPPPRAERRLDQEERPAAVNDVSTRRATEPPQPPVKPEPPFRVVRRRPKWFDPPSRFEDMTF